MKKIFALCALLGAIMLCILPAMAEEELPAAIQEALRHTASTTSAHWAEPGKDTWFALARTPDEINVLYCFTIANGVCTEHFHTNQAIPQGKNQIDIHLSDGAWDFSDSRNAERRYLSGPILLILQRGADDRSVEQMIAFQYSGVDSWNLISLKNYSVSANIKIEEDVITYYTVADKAQVKITGIVSCHPERDLRSMCLANIPLTFQQAQEMYAADEAGTPRP